MSMNTSYGFYSLLKQAQKTVVFVLLLGGNFFHILLGGEILFFCVVLLVFAIEYCTLTITSDFFNFEFFLIRQVGKGSNIFPNSSASLEFVYVKNDT